jgi:hypothetical protein
MAGGAKNLAVINCRLASKRVFLVVVVFRASSSEWSAAALAVVSCAILRGTFDGGGKFTSHLTLSAALAFAFSLCQTLMIFSAASVRRLCLAVSAFASIAAATAA